MDEDFLLHVSFLKFFLELIKGWTVRFSSSDGFSIGVDVI